MISPEYDPRRGIVRLPTRLLEATVSGDGRALDTTSDVGAALAALGALRDGRLDPALGPILEALRRPTRRFGLRTEDAGGVNRHRGWIGAHGVVTVSGDPDPDAVQDVRWAPRATSAARVLARLLDLGPSRLVVPDLPAQPVTWDDVTSLVREPGAQPWATAAFGSPPPRLHHLRWSADAARAATSVLLLLDGGDAGVVEAVPGDEGYALVARSGTEIWTALCALTRGS